MSNWVYTRDIPFASHNPSADQPVMQTNANSIDSLIQEDHFGFNDNQGGWHKVIHQNPEVADPAAIPTIGQTYTKTFDTKQNLYYRSGDGTIYGIVNQSLSGIHAIGVAPTTVFVVPDNCTGFVNFTIPVSINFPQNLISFSFTSFAGVLYVDLPKTYNTLVAPPKLVASVGGAGPNFLDFQISIIGAPYNAAYKYIFWPVL